MNSENTLPPLLAPGQCVIDVIGPNRVQLGPCPETNAAALVPGGGLGLLFALSVAGAGVWLYTEVERRRQLYAAVIQSLEGEL